jgi:prepilin-type N-terminal cleavage/methylation domain-containing protein
MRNKFQISNFKYQISNNKFRIGNCDLSKKIVPWWDKLEIANWKFTLRGFTMVELLIYMGILSILLTVLTNIFTTVIDVQLESGSTSSVQMDGRFMLNRLSYDVQRAASITTPNLGSQSASLALVINGQTNTYSLDGNNNLVLSAGATSGQINSYDTEVETITFTTIGNSMSGKNTVRVVYTLRSRIASSRGEDVQTFTTTVGMR